MGVTIHFSGRLRSRADAPRVVEELLDIAQTLDWPHVIIDDAEDVGISVRPHPECESFLLLFDAQGALRNPVLESDGYFCKTQFAPASVHVALVKLLRHLGKRWFAELTVVDEGGYWETGDLQELERHRRTVELALDHVERGLSHPEESDNDIASRIERILQEHQGRPVQLTHDEKRRALGPGLPDLDESESWSVEEWVEYFRRHDEEKHPLLKEMRGKPETLDALREAIRRAHEEQEKDEDAQLKYMARGQQRMQELSGEEKGDGFDLPEVPAPWEAASSDKPDPQDDPAWRLGQEFLKQFMDRASDKAHPVVEYVLSLALATSAGVWVAIAFVRDDLGPPTQLQARRLLAVERFQTIARLLRALPDAGLEALASGADKVARAFSAS
jgi:hypothetical protein